MLGSIPRARVRGRGVAVDSSDNIFVLGYSDVVNIPLANAWQTTVTGGYDVVVYKISGSDQSILYGSFFGGSSLDFAQDIVVLSDGSFVVGGTTWSSDLPTVNAFRTTFEGDEEAFVFRAKPDGTGPIFSTYAGTDEIRPGGFFGFDSLWSLDADGQDRVFFLSSSSAASASLLKPFQDAPADPGVVDPDAPPVDCLVTGLSKAGQLIYRSWLGGSGNELCAGDSDVLDDGTLWFGDSTDSVDVSLRRGFDESPPGSGGVKYYIGKISPRDPVRKLTSVPSFTGGTASEVGALLEADGSVANMVFRADVENSVGLGGVPFQDDDHFVIGLVDVGADVGGGANSDIAVLSRTVAGENRVQ